MDNSILQNEIFKAIRKFTRLSKSEFKKLTDEALGKYDVISKKEQKEYKIPSLLEKYIFSLRTERKSERTIDGYKLQIELFDKHTSKDIRRIETEDIRKYINYLINDRKNADSTINNYLHILQAFFKWCRIEGYIDKNPLDRISIKNFKVTRKRRGLDSDRLEAIRYACRNLREEMIVEIFAATGCRLSEVTTINIEDIDFSSNSINVIGKGNKKRTVFFNERCRLRILEYMKQQGITSGALIRSTKSPKARLKAAGLQAVIKEIGERVKINLYPHLLRHTFACQNRKKGMELEVIQVLLGHSNIVTTQIYAQEDLERIKYQYEQIA